MPAWIGPTVQIVGGAIQSLVGGSRARKATRELERMQTPVYKPSQSITDYYNQALERYNTNPYNSALYKRQTQGIDRRLSQGLSSLNDRGMALAGVNSLVQGSNDAYMDAAAQAEQQQAQNFAALGNATQMRAGEDQNAFQYNKLLPFERRSGLLSAKAAGGNAIMNAGLSNVFGGIQNYSNMLMKAAEMATGGLGGAAK